MVISIKQYDYKVEENHCNVIVINDASESQVTSTSSSYSLGIQIFRVLVERESKWILCLITYNTVIIYYLCGWITSTNSIALSAYVNTVVFNVFALLVCLISVWVSRNSLSCDGTTSSSSRVKSLTLEQLNFKCRSSCCYENPQAVNSTDDLNTKNITFEENNIRNVPSLSNFGLEKYEVLALLLSSCLALVYETIVMMDIISRIGNQPAIHTGRLGLGAVLGFLAHLGTILGYPDAGLNHVVCTALPCPTLKGRNPILSGNVIGAIILCGTHFVIHYWDLHMADTAAAFAVIGLTTASMLPLAFYTSSVILQKMPHHMIEQLDKCLREAMNIDGVLEFRNERFWTKSFGKLAGSLHVRIRRNANENHVIERVVRHLSTIVSSLRVQEFHEPPHLNAFVVPDHPPEYYIDEILPQTKNGQSRGWTEMIDRDVKVMRIEEILDRKIHRGKTFSISNHQTVGTRLRDESKCNSFIISERATVEYASIYNNENNVRIKNYFYRDDQFKIKNNLLFNGMRIDFDDYQNLQTTI